MENFGVNLLDTCRCKPSFETRLNEYFRRGFSIGLIDFDPKHITISHYKVIITPNGEYASF